MLKIKAYASAQSVKFSSKNLMKLDGWGKPLQTIYLRENHRVQDKLIDYKTISNYQTDFMDMIEDIIKKYPSWAITHKWGNQKLPRFYNDPTLYSINDLIIETRNHYTKGNDPILSMILRQKDLIRKLSKDLSDPNIIDRWDLDITFKNPHEPALQKFYDRGVFPAPAVHSNSFGDLFQKV